MSWDAKFDEPVPLPRNKQARKLREAADYVMKLPKGVQDLPEWQAAVSALMVVAEHKGPPMFARIGLMQALNRAKPPAARSERKDTPWGRRPLKRSMSNSRSVVWLTCSVGSRIVCMSSRSGFRSRTQRFPSGRSDRASAVRNVEVDVSAIH